MKDVAGLSELEQQAIARQQEGLDSFRPFLETAERQFGSGLEALLEGTTAAREIGRRAADMEFDPSMIDQYYDPFEEQVIQRTIDDFNRRAAVEDQALLADDISRVGESAFGSRGRLKREEVEADIKAVYPKRPPLAMVDSDNGITNLHVPSDVIIDASMPAMIRTSGCMWNTDGNTQETKAVIPDSSYAGVYSAVMESCKKHGAFDPTTMGTVPNVGLMAQKAEEYGSHPTTFQMAGAGVVRYIFRNNAWLRDP